MRLIYFLPTNNSRNNYRPLMLYFASNFLNTSFYMLVDRKSTRLNSSHPSISYAVFCLKKKKSKHTRAVETDHQVLDTCTGACAQETLCRVYAVLKDGNRNRGHIHLTNSDSHHLSLWCI